MKLDYRKDKFEIIGYSKDYFLDRKYMGSVRLDSSDRELYGYMGRREEVLEEDIILRKKKIKKGSIVVTELHQLCGRVIKSN